MLRHHRIKIVYISALLLLAAASVLIYLVLMQNVRTQVFLTDAMAIHVDQRNHVESILAFLDVLGGEVSQERRESTGTFLTEHIGALEQTAADYRAAHDTGPFAADVRRLYEEAPFQLGAVLAQFVDEARALADTDSATLSTDEQYRRVYQQALAVRDALDGALRELQGAERQQVEKFHGLAIAIPAGLLAILVAEGVFIFHPLEICIRRQQTALEGEIERRTQVEAALRRSEAHYRALARHLPNMAVMLFDSDMRFILADGPALSVVGFSREQIEGRTLAEVVKPSSYETLLPLYRAALAGQTVSAERIFNDRFYFTQFGPLHDDAGTIVGGIVTSQDLTELKRAEDALRASESRFRMISEILSDYAYGFEVGADGTLTAVWTVGAFAGITGYTPDEIRERGGWATFIHPDDMPLAGARAARLMRGEDDITEFRIITKSGEMRWLRDYGHPIQDAQGRVTHIFGAAQDITERKQFELALKESETRFRTIAEHASDLISLVDAHAVCVYANPAYAAVLGYNPAELVGKRMSDFVHPDDYQALRSQMLALGDDGRSAVPLEFHHRHADGHYRWMVGSISYFFYKSGGRQGGVVVLQDQTERRLVQALEVEQQKLQGMLQKEQELSALKTRMMTRITHEFRTPLSIIQSSVDILHRYSERLSAEQRTAKRTTILVQIRRITHMLDDIALAVNGDFTPARMLLYPADLQALCEDVVHELETESSHSPRFALAFDEPLVGHVDVGSFKRALYEILANAVRFSDSNTQIDVRGTLDADHLHLTVCDQGIGIPPDERGRIFDPFFRGSNISEMSGLGVGLTIAREVIQAHRGTLSVHNPSDGGTCVDIVLPLTDPPES